MLKYHSQSMNQLSTIDHLFNAIKVHDVHLNPEHEQIEAIRNMGKELFSSLELDQTNKQE